MPDSFTMKEMFAIINKNIEKLDTKMDSYISEDRLEKSVFDSRIDSLEQHKATVVSGFKVAAGLVSVVGVLFGILKATGVF